MKIFDLQDKKDSVPSTSILESLYEFGPKRVFTLLQDGASWVTHNQGKVLVAAGICANGIIAGSYFLHLHQVDEYRFLRRYNINQIITNDFLEHKFREVYDVQKEYGNLGQYHLLLTGVHVVITFTLPCLMRITQ